MKILERLQQRWQAPCGYREVLVLAVPLVLTTGSFSIQHFVDRMFLTWHSETSVSASMAAGILFFTMIAFVVGTVRYVSVFVAQYFGSGREARIGAVVWQGIYISLFCGLLVMAVAPLSGPLFRFIGHAPAVLQEEIIYFRILCLGAMPFILVASLDSFFTGLGRTWPLMWITVVSAIVNLVLDYGLIFGAWGLPAMGIAGAAWATVIAHLVSCLLFLGLITRPAYVSRFALITAWRFDPALCWRLLRFGLPSGIQFFIDVVGFSLFILMVGQVGTVELAATTIAFNINMLAFMPLFGAGIAVSILVGQKMGSKQPDLARRAAWSGFQLAMIYMVSIAATYVLLPQLYILPFAAKADPADFHAVGELAELLLRFVALYCIFDTLTIIFSSAIKGAGDTRFAMLAMGVVAGGVLVLPCYLVLHVFDGGIIGAWWVITIYIISLGAVFLLRFLSTRWETHQVTEEEDEQVLTASP